MRVTMLVEDVVAHNAAGGRLRVDGLAEGLSGSGVDVSVMAWEPRRADLNAWSRGRELRSPDRLLEVIAPPIGDVLHLSGLPLAHAAVAAARLGVPCVLDVCDSWPALALSSIRARGVRAVGALGSGLLLLNAAAQRASALTYIDETELRFDRRVSFPGQRRHVVPNGIAEELFSLDTQTEQPQRLVSVGDWSYHPNDHGLRWFLATVWPLIRDPLPLVLFGPHEPRCALPGGVEFRGFSASLSEVYLPPCVVIAPVLTGRGVKNKVLEAAAGGRPVVTTEEGVRGLAAVAPHIAVTNRPAAFAAAIDRLSAGASASVGAARAAVWSRRWTTSGVRLLKIYDDAKR